ncbi:hybrid sensor histidine kinase/response regulator [Haloarcula litorea]|uniref:hybrid sensor histidine kinase/response regulator n=1 Tax=Haloarcula litorea TaxID=3032579 RepID=UPI0023E80ABF|nr:response regulator [Halomicroarcula sp. GDY20]
MTDSNADGTPERPYRLLHVDDQPDFLSVTRSFLDRELPAAEVATETEPGDAIARLTQGSFDCVVSDYDMPGMDGLELLETIRADYPDLPFVLYTGKGSESIASSAINAGVTSYLQKGGPEQHRRLANRVEHAIEEYRAKRTSERYSAVLGALDYPVWVVDVDGTFEYVNDPFVDLTGYSRTELLGSEPGLIKTDESVERANEALRSVLSSDGPDTERFEVTIQPKDGADVPCRDHLAPLPFDDRYRGCAGILRDVTEQRERREKLEQQNQRLEEFVSLVSHDLRTPLSTARGAAELAAESGDPEYFEKLETAHERMDGMIDELLTLAREGRRVTVAEPVRIDTVAADAWEGLATEPARLTTDAPVVVEADPERLRRLFENLFKNSIEHGRPDGRSSSGDTAEQRDDGVEIAVGTTADDGFFVADDGPGIDADRRDAVFEPGFTTASDGTGFGLAIVKRIAEAHGWEVVVTESDAGGARIELTGVDFAPPRESADGTSTT